MSPAHQRCCGLQLRRPLAQHLNQMGQRNNYLIIVPAPTPDQIPAINWVYYSKIVKATDNMHVWEVAGRPCNERQLHMRSATRTSLKCWGFSSHDPEGPNSWQQIETTSERCNFTRLETHNIFSDFVQNNNEKTTSWLLGLYNVLWELLLTAVEIRQLVCLEIQKSMIC